MLSSMSTYVPCRLEGTLLCNGADTLEIHGKIRRDKLLKFFTSAAMVFCMQSFFGVYCGIVTNLLLSCLVLPILRKLPDYVR